VILLLSGLIIKELAFFAVIISHAHTTVFAHLLYILLMIAKQTDNLFDVVSWNIMTLFTVLLICILDLIVAVTTAKDFIAAWGSNFTPPSIMCTAMITFPNRQLVLHRISFYKLSPFRKHSAFYNLCFTSTFFF
jgi:hypothetical protein